MKFKPASSIPHDLRLITRFEAAKLLRCTTQTITNWVNKGVIKGHWIDKYLFVDRQSIEELFDTASDVARMEDKLSELKSKISEELSDKQQELIDLRKSKQITNQKKILRSVVDNSICIAKDIFDDKDNAIVTGYLQGKTTSEIASELNVSMYKVVKRANKSVPILLSRLDYNALRDDILTTDHIMELVQNQYDELVESGAYEREHEAWPDFTVDESQLDYMRAWLDDRFNYLDGEINAACGTWGIEAPEVPEPVEGPTRIVEIYPNPAKDRINIRFAEAGEAAIRLYDMTGRMVYSNASNTQVFVISTQGLGRGIYTLVTISGGKQQVDRVVVE